MRRFRRVLSVAGLAMMLAGCGQDKPVELANPDKAPSTDKKQKPAKTPKTARTDITPTPAPTPRPTPSTPQTTAALDVLMMKHDNGHAEQDGSWVLIANGTMESTVPLFCDFEIHFIQMEMRGTPYQNIWPEIKVAMYNKTTQQNFIPVPNTYVTAKDLNLYTFEVDPPLPAGDYTFTFRYLNNQDDPEKKEDRNVWVRRIALRNVAAIKE